MRVIPIVSAILVVIGLYILIFERDRAFDFARGGSVEATTDAEKPGEDAQALATDETTSEAAGSAEMPLVSVIAMKSNAREIDSAVLLRGRTEASRQVDMKAETSGQVVSEPLRKGSEVARGDLLCKLDPGTREASLAEALARLAEAKARIPEAEASLAEAQSRVPAMAASLAQARSQVPAMEAALAEALSRVPAAEASLAEAKSRVPAMEAALAEALSRVTSAEAALAEAMTRPAASEAGVAEAEARLSEAEINHNAATQLAEGGFASDTRVANALATLVSARAGLQNALSQLESAHAGIEAARSQVEGAKAGVQSAKSQVEGAKAGIQSAQSQIEGAIAGVQSAKSSVEGAKAGVQSAKSQIDAALAGIESALSQIEGAKAGVQSARAQVENAKAGTQSAEASVAAARLDITRLEIHAPFAGLLETDTAELGSLLQPGALCATIVQIDPIKLVGFVPEVDVDKVHTGAMAGGRLNNGRDLVGQVSFLSRVADPLTRTFRVEVEVPNTDESVSDGLTVEILIASDGRMAHLLPQSSLTLDDDGNLGVRVVGDGDTALFMPVTMIRDSIEGVWVAGLPDVVDVIVTGQNYVSDGVALAVTYREPET